MVVLHDENVGGVSDEVGMKRASITLSPRFVFVAGALQLLVASAVREG